MERLKIGLVSSSQKSFPGDKKGAFARTSAAVAKLANEWNFDLYIYEKEVIVANDGYAAARAMEDQKVDFILLQTTSFSAGFLAPIFARIKNAYLGLWAIPEGTTDGPTPFNSLCGVNMYCAIIGHYLDDYKIPLKWYFGDAEDPLFRERLHITVRALSAIKKIKNSSIALIGGLAPGFDDLYDDERRLISRFDGIKINRLPEYDEIKKLAENMEKSDVAKRIEEESSWAKGFLHPTAKEMMEINARYALAYERFVKENGYDAIAISCWPKFQDDYLYSVCAVVGELNDKEIVAACEGDLTSALSMLFLKHIAGDVTMLMDMSAFDREDDTLLLWHCGPASKRFCEENGFCYSLNYSGKDHGDADLAHALGTGTVRDMIFDPGKVTIARITGEADRMFLATGSFIDYEKPSFHGSRGWIGKLSLNRRPISALDLLNTIFVQRFQHHFPIVKGDFSKEVMEAMAWLKLGEVEAVPYEDYMQNPLWWRQ